MFLILESNPKLVTRRREWIRNLVQIVTIRDEKRTKRKEASCAILEGKPTPSRFYHFKALFQEIWWEASHQIKARLDAIFVIFSPQPFFAEFSSQSGNHFQNFPGNLDQFSKKTEFSHPQQLFPPFWTLNFGIIEALRKI